MTKRDFFRLLIKVFTLYSVVISIFTLFPQLILLNQMLNNAEIVLVYIGCLLIVVLISYILVKYTDKIIDFLRLDKEFDNDQIIIGNLDTLSIFKFTIILIGGFMIVENFPKLLMDILNEFKFRITSNPFQTHEIDYFWLGVRFLNLLFGYLLITNCKTVAKFLNKN